MTRLGAILALFGFGSALLHFTDRQFSLLTWSESYQPFLGLIMGGVGAVLLAIPVLRGKDGASESAPPAGAYGPPPGGYPASPAGGFPAQGSPAGGFPAQGGPVPNSPAGGFPAPGGYGPPPGSIPQQGPQFGPRPPQGPPPQRGPQGPEFGPQGGPPHGPHGR